MAVHVSFMKPGGLGSVSAVGVGDVRASEVVSVPGTTTGAAEAGEIAVIVSTETAAILAAKGRTPNASATAATAATSAGFAVLPNDRVPVQMSVGDKIAVAALS